LLNRRAAQWTRRRRFQWLDDRRMSFSVAPPNEASQS
jgi:hypothetical protein